jgi:hypothetical protein
MAFKSFKQLHPVRQATEGIANLEEIAPSAPLPSGPAKTNRATIIRGAASRNRGNKPRNRQRLRSQVSGITKDGIGRFFGFFRLCL